MYAAHLTPWPERSPGTSDDIAYIIDQLTGTDAENQPFYAVTTRFLLPDGVTWVEPGLYIKDARIANGTIKTAMIGFGGD